MPIKDTKHYTCMCTIILDYAKTALLSAKQDSGPYCKLHYCKLIVLVCKLIFFLSVFYHGLSPHPLESKLQNTLALSMS